MTLRLADVCTDEDLAGEIGGPAELANITSEVNTAKGARTSALEDVLADFANRIPPIYESDISTPAELKRVVTYGALARLYRSNLTTGGQDDVNAAKHKIFKALYDSTLNALRPSVAGTLQKAASPNIALHRR